MRSLCVLAVLFLAGCGSAPPEKKAASAPQPVLAPVPAPVKDSRALLLAENQKSASIVPDHLLGKKELPGGTLGEYAAGGTAYQLFIIETPSAQDAAIMLLDLKGTLQDPAYIAYMGGYSGTDAGKPVYAFAKLKYLAGVVGLPEKKADPIARELAARLR